MKIPHREKLFLGAGLLAGLLPFIYAVYSYIGGDLWGDEIHSLEYYSLIGFKTTVTQYLEPNNHVFFNVIMSLLLKIMGIHDFNGVIDNLAALRTVQMLFGLGTLAYVYLFARRFIGNYSATISILLLSTTIPFLNYAMQLRGYSLSAMSVAALLYYSWGLASRPSRFPAAMTALAAGILLYTIPSNAYIVLSFLALWGMEYLIRRLTKFPVAPGFSAGGVGYCFIFTAVGGAAAVAAYSPMIKQIFSNSFVSRVPMMRLFVPATIFPDVTINLLSGRYLLPAAAMIGLCLTLRRLWKNKSAGKETGGFIRLAILYATPFLIACIRNDFPLDRSFVMLAPVFSVLLASGMGLFTGAFPQIRGFGLAIRFLTILYCLICCGSAFHHARQVLDNDIDQGGRRVDIMHNYFQSSRYRPYADLKILAASYRKNPGPVIVVGNVDRAVVLKYLDRLKVFDYYAVLNYQDDSTNSHFTYFNIVAPDTDGTTHGIRSVRMPKITFLKGDSTLSPWSTHLFVPLMIALHAARVLDPYKSCYVVTACRECFTSLLDKMSRQFNPELLGGGASYTALYKIAIPDSLDLRSKPPAGRESVQPGDRIWSQADRYPPGTESAFSDAMALLNRDSIAAATRFFGRMESGSPDYPVLFSHLYEACRQKNDLEHLGPLLKILFRAYQKSPGSVMQLFTKQTFVAILRQYNDYLIDRRGWADAYKVCTALSAIDGDRPDYQVMRAQCFAGLNEFDSAGKICSAILADHPDCAPASQILHKIVMLKQMYNGSCIAVPVR
jgi:hypothetical protein